MPRATLLYMGGIDSIPSADPADIPGAVPYVVNALDAVLAGNPVPGGRHPRLRLHGEILTGVCSLLPRVQARSVRELPIERKAKRYARSRAASHDQLRSQRAQR
jgi:hypothetical protein